MVLETFSQPALQAKLDLLLPTTEHYEIASYPTSQIHTTWDLLLFNGEIFMVKIFIPMACFFLEIFGSEILVLSRLLILPMTFSLEEQAQALLDLRLSMPLAPGLQLHRCLQGLIPAFHLIQVAILSPTQHKALL